MLTTIPNSAELAALFPDNRDRGILKIGEWLMDKFGWSPEESHTQQRLFMYTNGEGNRVGVPIFPEGTHPYFRVPGAQGDLGPISDIEEGSEPPIPAVVLNLPIIQPPTAGDESGYSFHDAGFNEYGKQKRLRFPIKMLVNLYYTVTVMRDNPIEAQYDQTAWRLFWKRHQFISPADGVHNRTRMASDLVPGVVPDQVGSLILMSGAVVIERVWLVDTSIAEETAAVENIVVDVCPSGDPE